MLQIYPIECNGTVGKPGGNQSFSVDDWNYVVVIQAKGNVTIKTSGGETGEPIGPLTQALGITTGQKVGKGVIQVESDQAETVIIAFSGDGSRVTGFASGGAGASMVVPLPVIGETPAFMTITDPPVIIGFNTPGGQATYAHSSDSRGLDVKQYYDFGGNDIAGSATLNFKIGTSCVALVTFEVTTADTGGAVTPAISGNNGGFIFQPQIRDLNRVQTVSGSPTYAKASVGALNNVGDRVAVLVAADCLDDITAEIVGVNGDGVVHCTISASPVGSIQ